MCDFKDAKVGDKVWSLRFGWGTVEDMGAPWKNPTQFGVRFLDKYRNYYPDGRQSGDDPLPTLFWDEVKIVPPPKPKRTTIRKVVGFVEICGCGHIVRLKLDGNINKYEGCFLHEGYSCDYGGTHKIAISGSFEVEE